MRVIGVVSLSGGQGKTTTTFFLGLHLSKRGKKTLWIDADPQANLTFFSGVQNTHESLEKVFRGELDVKNSICSLTWDNLFIIPTDGGLARINEYLSSSGNGGRMLMRRLKAIHSYFDFCLIDAPPAISQIVFSVIGASSDILIPFEVALKGTNCLVSTIQLLLDLADLEIWNGKVLGVLPFRDKWYGFNQLIDARENMDAVKSYLNNQFKIFPAILESAKYRSAIRQGKTLAEIGYPELDAPFLSILQSLGEEQDGTN
jgi:chromosome partitioning protein